MTGHCAYGAVSVTITNKPAFINDCNCSLCRKVGAAWGYFPSSDVSAKGHTSCFSRSDKGEPAVAVHSCAACGTTTHFGLTDSFKDRHPEADQMGVNMRLFDPERLADVEVRYPDGRAWSGEGDYAFRSEPKIIGQTTFW
ncbi:MAG: aldehyde-activating protein [Pseudomonadota bacterium]